MHPGCVTESHPPSSTPARVGRTEHDQSRAFVHEISLGEVREEHRAFTRGGDGIFHLHRLQYNQLLTLRAQSSEETGARSTTTGRGQGGATGQRDTELAS